jgi:hypothetical protein
MSYAVQLTFNEHNKEIKKLIHPLQQELARTYELLAQIEDSNFKGQELARKYIDIMSREPRTPDRESSLVRRANDSSPSLTRLKELDAIQSTLRLKLKNVWDAPAPVMKPEPIQQQQQQTNLDQLNQRKVAPLVFACESITIRAGDDFRVQIPYSLFPAAPEQQQTKIYHLSWNFELKSNQASAATARDDSKHSMDIGFAISELQSDGSLPQLIAYQRYGKAQKTSGEALLLMQEEDEERHMISIKDNRSMPMLYRGDGSCIVIFFDNSYSFFRGKELRYHVSIEPYITPPPPIAAAQTQPSSSIADDADDSSLKIEGHSDNGDEEVVVAAEDYNADVIALPNQEQSLQLIGLCEELVHFLGTNDVYRMLS